MPSQLHKNAQRVQDILIQFGYSLTVVELPDSTRTAQEAASAIGCSVSQIAKSLVFWGKNSNEPLLIITSGTNRVNEKAVGVLVGEPLVKADAIKVQEYTGFPIGGVSPVGHKNPIRTYIDEDLLTFETIWAAAGTPHAVFELTPQILLKVTGGVVIQVK
jgi:prolyl-tRNA editing enzyme YbaK/EbsC (Cys-tRNA(Pro) deacylase)